MTSTIKVDNINKVSDDSTIIKKCGTTTTVGSGSGQTIVVDGATVTLGRCGGAVNLASGATQSGFGRTGTVDWCTTAKTSPFVSVNGKGYFVNTSGGAVTVTLPASPSAGDIVAVNDLNGTADCNAITLGRNSSKINGACSDVVINTERQSTTVIYSGATQGWVAVSDANAPSSALNIQYNIRYLVVAGGGSGSGATSGGGGGAGGYRTVCSANFGVLSGSSFPITVGGGGTAAAPGPTDNRGNQGTPSTFSTITSTGGGGGAGNTSPASDAQPGGSGGGGKCAPPAAAPLRPGGSGNTPPVSPPQGNDGGTNSSPPSAPWGWAGSGGGGAGAVGANGVGGPPGTGGAGGLGATTDIFGSAPQAPSYGMPGPAPGRYFAGGGGAGVYTGTKGAGGCGGGGPGNTSGNNNGSNGTANTGGGGGGGDTNKYTGGSGIVIIKHTTADASPAVSGGNVVLTCGSDTIRIFTGDGTFVS
jgi:hypothetical protein|tara:strand:- start:87 stop:1508 length:1422 start_codon:yes stop_codon:yes gene_type:complete